MKIPHKELSARLPATGDEKSADDYSAIPQLALTADADCAGLRLDQALARLCPQHSRSRLQNWIRQARVSVNGRMVTEPRHKLWGGEALVVAEAPDERLQASQPEAIALSIVHEDESLIVIDKPPGLVVHPGSGNWSGTLQNALLHHAPSLERLPRAGIVHRLDKDTSGLMVVAKTLEAQTDLVRQLQARSVKRHYQALARGQLETGGTVDAPMGRHPSQRTKMAVIRNGKPARTHYRVLERFLDCTLIECALETGRTHQIRVHLTHIGHPLVGDPVYGAGTSRVPAGPAFARQALHACRLGLTHPATGKPMRWKSALPEDFAELLASARQRASGAAMQALEEDEWDDEDFANGPQIIYAWGDGPEDDDELE